MDTYDKKLLKFNLEKELLAKVGGTFYETENISFFIIDKKYNLLMVNKRCKKFIRDWLHMNIKERDNIYELSQKFIEKSNQYETVKSLFLELDDTLRGQHVNIIKVIYSKELCPEYLQVEYIPIKDKEEVVGVLVYILNITNYENSKFELLQLKKRLSIIDDINKIKKDSLSKIKNSMDMLLNINFSKEQKQCFYKLQENINGLFKNLNGILNSLEMEDAKFNEKQSKEEFRVLVADDCLVNRTLVSQFLRKNGCIGTAVSNGKEVLDALKKQKYDLVLMDISMPIINGVETTIRIREINKFKKIPIIAMTAYEEENNKEYFVKIGMDEYLKKPIDKEKLFTIVDKYRNKQISPKVDCDSVKSNKSIDPFKMLEEYLEGDCLLVIELAEKVIDMFSNKQMDKLTKIISNGDKKEIREIIHKMKGTVSNFGLNNIENLLQKLADNSEFYEKNGLIIIIKKIRREITNFTEKKDKYKKKAIKTGKMR